MINTKFITSNNILIIIMISILTTIVSNVIMKSSIQNRENWDRGIKLPGHLQGLKKIKDKKMWNSEKVGRWFW